jgi:hypothetical protein
MGYTSIFPRDLEAATADFVWDFEAATADFVWDFDFSAPSVGDDIDRLAVHDLGRVADPF